jgi:hypothetical protein
MVNCVSASASAQHIEAPIITNNNLPDSGSGFYCQDQYFFAGVEISGRLWRLAGFG